MMGHGLGGRQIAAAGSSSGAVGGGIVAGGRAGCRAGPAGPLQCLGHRPWKLKGGRQAGQQTPPSLVRRAVRRAGSRGSAKEGSRRRSELQKTGR